MIGKKRKIKKTLKQMILKNFALFHLNQNWRRGLKKDLQICLAMVLLQKLKNIEN